MVRLFDLTHSITNCLRKNKMGTKLAFSTTYAQIYTCSFNCQKFLPYIKVRYLKIGLIMYIILNYTCGYTNSIIIQLALSS